jgi:aspartyl protease family protein
MRNVMAFAIVALIAAAAVPRLYAPTKGATAAAPAAPAAPAARRQASAAAASYPSSMTIERSANGQFSVSAVVDGRSMEFLVDTGASSIVLRESDAARLGIHPARRDYVIRASTANGVVYAAPVQLERVEVGSLMVRDVRAVVLPDEALNQNLLGMTFLSRVRWEHRDGRLVLEQ